MLYYVHSETLTTRCLNSSPSLRQSSVVTVTPFAFHLLAFLPLKQRTCEIYAFIGRWEIEVSKLGTRYGVDFVTLKVSPEEKAKFEQWQVDNEADLPEMLINLVGDNYKLSLNLDIRNDCFIVSATGTDDNRVNRGLCMTARSDELMEALFLLLYKHYVMCEGGSWGQPSTTQSSWG